MDLDTDMTEVASANRIGLIVEGIHMANFVNTSSMVE